MNPGRAWRRFRAAAWLGWEIDGNWADPLVFTLYTLAKPLATGFLLLVVYRVSTGGSTGEARFAWMWVGNSFFPVVPLLLLGLSWAIVDDREIYQMLKYVSASPVGLFLFLAGRAVTKGVLCLVACGVLLGAGALLGVEARLTAGSAAYGAAALALGLAGTFGLGLALAGIGLVLPRQTIGLNEGLAGLLYLLGGAVFPLDLLPRPLAQAALWLPIPWWLEAMRRSLHIPPAGEVLGTLGAAALASGLAATAVAWCAAGVLAFRLSERRARELGLLDVATNF